MLSALLVLALAGTPIAGDVRVVNLPPVQTVALQAPIQVVMDGGITSVDNFPAIQAVSQSGLWSAFLSNTLPLYVTLGDAGGSGGGGGGGGAVTQSGDWSMLMVYDGGAIPVSGTFYQATQPISGTVVATESGAWTVQVDGGYLSASQAGGWSVLMVYDGGGFPVTGTFYQATQPVSESGAWAVQVDGGYLNASESGNWSVLMVYDGGALPVSVSNVAPIYVTLGDAGSSGGSTTVPQPLAVTIVDGGPIQVEQSTKPWAVTVVDGGLNVNNLPTNFSTVGVAAASSPATSLMPALVVALSPNTVPFVSQSGTWTVTESAAGWKVQGMTASNTTVTNPVPAAVTATNDAAAPSTGTATAGNQAAVLGDRYGRMMVQDFHPNHWFCQQTAITSTTQCQATPGAGLSLYVTDLILNEAAAGGTMTISAGTGTNCGSTNVAFFGPIILSANSSVVVPLRTPIKLTANTEMCVAASQTAAFMISGFTAP